MQEEHYVSEKAKGKRRAYPIEIPSQEESRSTIPQTSPTKSQEKQFIIRFTDGTPDMGIRLRPEETVRALKNIVS